MNDFFTLIGQIFIVSLIQLILEIFIDADKRPYQALVINLACFLGSLYFLIDFLFSKVFASLSSLIQMPF